MAEQLNEMRASDLEAHYSTIQDRFEGLRDGSATAFIVAALGEVVDTFGHIKGSKRLMKLGRGVRAVGLVSGLGLFAAAIHQDSKAYEIHQELERRSRAR
jgi:hypothetical protein